MKVVIVLLAAFVLALVRTTIICGNELNIDTNHNNNKNCCSTTTIATINANIRNYGNGNDSRKRISTHTKILKTVSNSSKNSLALVMMIIMVLLGIMVIVVIVTTTVIVIVVTTVPQR